MRKDEDDKALQHNFPAAIPVCCHPKKIRMSGPSVKASLRFQAHSEHSRKGHNEAFFPESFSSTSKAEPYSFQRSISRVGLVQDCVSTSAFLANDNTKQKKVRTKLIELFKEDITDDEDSVERVMSQKDCKEEGNGKGKLGGLSFTKEFHVLTEIQKSRILSTVEDTIKKLASSDLRNFCNENPEECPTNQILTSLSINPEKLFDNKFFFLCALLKILEIAICQIIQLTFLSNEQYYKKTKEFLPVVVTYYLTLSIILISLLMHISCYPNTAFRHPCFFMCHVSSSILTLTTVMGIIIMLCSMEFYRSFKEILVIVFLGGFLFTLAVELCVCYREVKNFWSKLQPTDQYYSC